MFNPGFKTSLLPFLVFPAFLAAAVKLIFGNIQPSGMGVALSSQCTADSGAAATPYLLQYTGLPPVDAALCPLVSFFQETMNDPVASQYLLYIITTGSIFVILPAVEASRARRSAWIAFPSLWLLGSQLWTIGATMPIYWLVFTLTSKSQPHTKEAKKITQPHAEAILFSLCTGAAVPSFAMLYLRDPEVTAIWQPYPAIVAVASTVHLLIRKPARITQSGWPLIQLTLIASFILSSSFHMAAIWPLLFANPSLLKTIYIPSIRHVDPAAATGLKTLQFLQWDYTIAITSTMAATLWFAKSMRQVAAMVVWFAAGSVVVGPSAAVTAVALWRESNLQ